MTDAQQQRYRVLERLASGGMAEVFIAESAGIEGFKKQVAIKRVLPQLSEKKRFISMFLDEARLSAQLSHSNVVQVFDIGVGDNAYFIVMEYVDGADLKGVIEYMRKQNRPFPVEAAVFIASKICEGLSYAHELRSSDGGHLHIVHRDMSPPNVLITKYGEVKIVDFGLAKATSQLEKSEAGIIKGKFSYLAPEAAQGQDVDHRADVFAVGIILWEMLAGRRLFLGDSDFQTVKLVQQAAVPRVADIRRDVPRELDDIIQRSLAREPDRRYATARSFGRDLVEFLYRYGKAVSAFDVADIVRGAMSLRKRVAPDKASIIDKLIEEALLEFTSLQEEKGQGANSSAPKLDDGLKIAGFEDIGNWADEVAAPQATGSRASLDMARGALPARAFEEGNLAALEDDFAPGGASSRGPASLAAARLAPTPLPPSTRTAAPATGRPAAGAIEPAAPAPAPAKKSSAGLIGAIALFAVVAAAAGAWFGGLIPH